MRQKPIELLDLTPDTDVEALLNDIIRHEVCAAAQLHAQHGLRAASLARGTALTRHRSRALPLERGAARSRHGSCAWVPHRARETRIGGLPTAAPLSVRSQPLVSENRKMQLRKLLYKLIEKIDVADVTQNFYLFKILRAHILPLTNCAFNKSGDRFITGSYDRTCKVWNTLTGEELLTLEGHKNVVYAIAFNNPFGDKIVTGSFDKTAKCAPRAPARTRR
jgi:hypothetical protein